MNPNSIMCLQIEDVYPTMYETCGQYWPYVHSYIFFAIVLMQITMIGLFGLKSKPAASIATVPLLVFSLLFNEYCKLRFLPSFQHNLVEVLLSFDLAVYHLLIQSFCSALSAFACCLINLIRLSIVECGGS